MHTMSNSAYSLTRLATRSDAEKIGQLLHDFNEEFGEPSPMPEVLEERIDRLLQDGGTTVV